ncbi:KH domain-containing protein [Raphanus sativus]|uniref:Uncharacterized protein LOC108854451 n=1 Tax=Raphanus sativus TaxID=3726 RepID=A0A6J0NG62_RAPSA|nr:uncharacterized protein LOC108854451 [Raphanus sativus]KAJ4903032.1 KH domain-containing protein [Raphanus sativus]
MADESQYSNKRKYEEQTAPPPSTRRPTGFSSGPIPSSSPDPSAVPPPSSYNSVPPPMDEIQIAKQKAQEIAARLLNSADAKRPRVDNNVPSSYDYGGDKGGFSSSYSSSDGRPAPSSIPVSYGNFTATTKKIDIPNMRVGVIIGKGGETIKSLQLQSGAKIQVTRDMDADPNAATRTVDLTGTQDQISRAEELINEVLQDAETGGQAGSGGGGSRRMMGGQPGADQFVMKIPNNKVGLVIGKGGETIKSMQANTGARIQVIPLHLPPGDPTPERTLQIDGTTDQIEHAKQLVNEILSGENRMRNSSMGGGYQQQGYQARPPSSWAPPNGPPAQQAGYGYMQQGAYPGPPQYGQSPYGSYPQQTSAGYSQGEYDYYGQQQSQAPNSGGSSAPPTDPYSYYQNASGYGQAGQGYQQDGYGGYNASQQSGYGQAGYDQQQGGYGSTTNPGQEEDTSQAAPASSAQSGQAGYGATGQEPTQGSTGQAAYGAAPTSQAGYSSQPPTAYSSGYGAPPPAGKPPAYAQNQQSPGAPGSYGYAQPAASGYGQPPAYGYGQAPQGYGSYGGYAQPPAAGGYSSDGSAGTTAPGGGGGGTPASQSAPAAGPPKASPKS